MSKLYSLLNRPILVIVAVTIMCISIFVATIPLPRVDNNLVGSDGVLYYTYLPATWIDFDLKSVGDYAKLLEYPTDIQGVKYPVGTPLLWSPFFLIAHGMAVALKAVGLSIETNGHSYWYQSITLIGSICYGGLALWFLYRLASEFVSREIATLSASVAVLGGSLIYYTLIANLWSQVLGQEEADRVGQNLRCGSSNQPCHRT